MNKSNHKPQADRPDHQVAIPWEDYRDAAVALAGNNAVRRTKTVALAAANNHYLAADVVSEVPIPTFTNSAMDGYALTLTEDEVTLPVRFRIIGEQPAGRSRDLTVHPGEAVRIMTGAPLPQGANVVVRSEYTEEDGDQVIVTRMEKRGANIRMEGEDQEAGAVILKAGTKLSPRDLSAVAAVGQDSVQVHDPLKVAIVSTGDELVAPGEPLNPGEIYESNSILLQTLIENAGFVARVVRAVEDTEEALARSLDECATWADAALITGGVSFGKYDIARNLLGNLPESMFTRAQMQPGKPQGHGIWTSGDARIAFMAFPGNPVSVFVSYQVLGLPFLSALLGVPFTRTTLSAVAGETWRSPKGRVQFLPGKLVPGAPGSLPTVYPVSPLGSGSHLVTSLAGANVLAVGPRELSRVEQGSVVEVELF